MYLLRLYRMANLFYFHEIKNEFNVFLQKVITLRPR